MGHNKTERLVIAVFLLTQGILGYLLSGKCGKPGDVGKIRYSIKNTIQSPTFFHTVEMDLIGCNDTVMTKYMELACDNNKQTFRNFSNTYFPGVGYYISAINGVKETSGKTYWEFIEHTTGQQYQVGHNNYTPQPGDHVAWNLTLIGSYNTTSFDES